MKTIHPKMKLINFSIMVGFIGEFDAKEHFAKNKYVKYSFEKSFKKHVLDPAKIIYNFPERGFSKHQFTERIKDKEITEHFEISLSKNLMTREEILWVIASLTDETNKTNILSCDKILIIIGYMLCVDGITRVINVYFDSNQNTCYCYCNRFDDWDCGDQIIFPN